MNLDIVLAALGSNPAARGENPIPRADEWETSVRTLPPAGLFFLEPAYVTAACAEVSMPDVPAAATMAAAQRIAAHSTAVDTECPEH